MPTPMPFTTLGRSDIQISRICLGTMTWGHQNSESEGHAQMDRAVEKGINFFDTAEMYAVPPSAETYGKTETIIGSWFAARKNRDKIVLASKVVGGRPWIRDGAPIDRKNIMKAVEDSLKRLQTDYLDLYQLHWPNRGHYHMGSYFSYQPRRYDVAAETANFIEVLETMADLVKQGKIRHMGLSNESAWGTMKYLQLAEKHNLPRVASIQNEYGILCRRFEPDLAEVCLNEDVSLLAYSPLAMGLATGKYLDGKRPEGSRITLQGNGTVLRMNPESEAAAQAYVGIAQKHGLDPSQMALAYILQKPFMTSAIIGATTLEQLETDIDAVAVALSDEVVQEIEAVRKRYPLPF